MSDMTQALLLATRNEHKVSELGSLLEDQELDIQILSLADFRELGEIDEDGETFAENAAKKALFTGVLTGHVTLADDSGLEVDCLSGLPGVRSSRYAGEGAPDEANNIKLLAALGDVPEGERSARFRSVVAIFVPGDKAEEAAWDLDEFWADALENGQLASLDSRLVQTDRGEHWHTPWGNVTLVAGTCEGYITLEPRGNHGFGYDPVFFYPELGRTFGELPAKVKNQHSHRARAFCRAVKVLREVLGNDSCS